jgi:hypothetical protein
LPPRHKVNTPPDIDDMIHGLEELLDTPDSSGHKVGDSQYGVYAFYDYDGEPIYVGQTAERLRVRIRRHLTNQRTDAVAMAVLDPMEVAEVEMWPLRDIKADPDSSEASEVLDRAEHAVLQRSIRQSSFGSVLNEGDISPAELISLDESIKGRIVSREVYDRNVHPDIRIARRAATIASLAKVVSERNVSVGLRRTLVTQARRLEALARDRLNEAGVSYDDWLRELQSEAPDNA